MTEPTTTQLSEDAVREIEARQVERHKSLAFHQSEYPNLPTPDYIGDIDALIRDWKAMRARIEMLTTDWCECGHARDKHQFFSDHDECYECDQASPDLCCEWRPAPRTNENAALREQLAETRSGFATIQTTNEAVERKCDALRSQLAQVKTTAVEKVKAALADFRRDWPNGVAATDYQQGQRAAFTYAIAALESLTLDQVQEKQ